jgi:hypothetical protein
MSDTPRTDTESDTPRTDDFEDGCINPIAWADFARQLERELAEVTKQRDALADALAEVRAWGYRSTKERLSVFINKALAGKTSSHEP